MKLVFRNLCNTETKAQILCGEYVPYIKIESDFYRLADVENPILTGDNTYPNISTSELQKQRIQTYHSVLFTALHRIMYLPRQHFRGDSIFHVILF